MGKEIQIREATENAEANFNLLATLPDSVLAEKIDAIHLQMQLAEEKKNTAAIELFEIWRSQVIAARICKAENTIADTPNEIAVAIADIETVVVKAEQRQEVLNEFKNPFKQQQHKEQTPHDNDNQLSLF